MPSENTSCDKLRAVFDRPEFAWLVKRLAQRVASGRPLKGIVSRADASPEERRALDDLLGRRSTSGAQLTLDLSILESQLRGAGLIDRLDDVVFACCGAVANAREAREQLRERWRLVFESARSQCGGSPALLEWLSGLERDGTLKRLGTGEPAAATRLLEDARQIVTRDVARETLLANLAAEVAGDSHALDRGQPLATLCLRAIALLHGIDGQASADSRRDAWAALGVAIDDLSAPVLVFNLHASVGSQLEQILRLHREQGEPAFLTYRQISHGGGFAPLPSQCRTVYICENPAVVSAAARELGGRCFPLVCTNGQPASSVRILLRKLQAAGAELRCHADFDWAGLRIVDQLIRSFGAHPWRMQAADFEQYEGKVALAHQSFQSAWSLGMAEMLRARRVAVYEEQTLRDLLGDLAGFPVEARTS